MDLDDQELEATKELWRRNKEKELDKLINQLTMLYMQDHWDSSDFKFKDELEEKIKRLEKELDKK